MADAFGGYIDSPTAQPTHARVVVPSDTADLADIPKALYVGTGGNIAMIGVGAPAGATGIVWKNIPAGALLPFRARRILATGTTAADMLVLY